ncbi:glycosyltransferase family 4 protein [Thermodesulfobacteriota bacterium]
MKIGFVSEAISEDIAGVGRYAKNVFSHLAKMGHPPIPIDWQPLNSSKIKISGHIPDPILIPNPWPIMKTTLWHLFLLKMLRHKADSLDIVFNPSQFPHPIGQLNVPFVYVVHDVSFMRFPECHRRGKKIYFQLFLRNTLQKADAIVCDSEYTRKEILKYFDVDYKKIVVIYLAAENNFHPITDGEHLERIRHIYNLPKKFLLSVGTIEPRKNLNQLFQAYHLLGNRIPFPLFIAGKPGWRSGPIFKFYESLNIHDRVKFLGYVPDQDLPALYNLATALVYASKDEGFGLPPLEAMQCGTPAVVSDAGSIPEIVGDGALIVPSNDPHATGDALMRICEDASLYNRLKIKGLDRSASFCWENTAEELMVLFQRLITGG